MTDHGTFVVSLDFELHWGVRDKRSVDQYKANLLGVREAIPRMLDLFDLYGVHATWATVGLLFAENKDELLASLPEVRPTYADSRLDPYAAMDGTGEDERRDPFHYAPSLIEQIRSCPGQEIGTHTFSHYYCLEAGQTREQFQADIEAAVRIARRHGVTLNSIVFPRNQVNEAYLPVCEAAGLMAYRGTEEAWFCTPGDRAKAASPVNRALRFVDAYLPVARKTSLPGRNGRGLANLRSSRFLRPYASTLASFESLRLRRITDDLGAAAKNKRVFHLWWHPHNFGVNLKENLKFLESILLKVTELRDGYGMRSLSMAETLTEKEPAYA